MIVERFAIVSGSTVGVAIRRRGSESSRDPTFVNPQQSARQLWHRAAVQRHGFSVVGFSLERSTVGVNCGPSMAPPGKNDNSRFLGWPAALVLAICLLATAGALHAAEQGRVLCTVVDRAGAPVPDAQVRITMPGTEYEQKKTTNARGEVTFLVVDATREYLIRIERDGFVTLEEQLRFKLSDTVRITYALQPVVAEPKASRRITGIVLFEDGEKLKALPGAVVTLLLPGSLDAAKSHVSVVVTDEEGAFVFSNLAPGPYVLRVQLAGFLDAEVGPLPMEESDLLVSIPNLRIVLIPYTQS